MRAGLFSVVLSLALVFLPLLWGEWELNKYVVATGLLGVCLGLSFLLHGTWDWIADARRRRRRNR